MAKHSAGILMYRFQEGVIEVFLVHPGGPFWAKKDDGAWSIPKGEFIFEEEDALEAAKREFEEKTGFALDGSFIPMDTVNQSGRKIIHAWAIKGNCDPAKIKSNTFQMEWPPRPGKHQEFPEVDRADWFDINTAKTKLLKAQVEFLERLINKLKT